MKLKTIASDFEVDERLRLDLAPAGSWAVYRLSKEGLTTLQVQARLASRYNLPRTRVVFPALKDRVSVSRQHLALPAGLPPLLEGPGFQAERLGYSQRALEPADLLGNTFGIVVRDLGASEAAILGRALGTLAEDGLPNYFDAQRMGSYVPGWGFIGQAILRRDASEALRAYLTLPSLGDPAEIQRFKAQGVELWPDWGAMMAIAPRPSNYRSVLTYLIDHPEGYRKALNLIPQRLLALFLSAYQSHIWNCICSRLLEDHAAQGGSPGASVRVAARDLWVTPDHERVTEELRALAVPLPHHRTRYAGILAEPAQAVLEAEGLTLADFKARILQRAYVGGGKRALVVVPEAMHVDEPMADERHTQRWALRVRFSLPPGSYATLVIKAAAAKASLSEVEC